MADHTRAWLQIHFCVVLWGFTAILGKLITMPALPLVLWRMLIVSVALLLLPRVWRGLRALPTRLLLIYAGIGTVVSLHWLTFYGAIKLANASVAATCLATIPVFLSVIEPLLTGSRFNPREVVIGLLVLPGIILLVGGTPESMNAGILVGVLSAFFVAIFSALNKRYIHRADSLSVTAIEMGAGGIFLLLTALVLGLISGELLNGELLSGELLNGESNASQSAAQLRAASASFFIDVRSIFSMPSRNDVVLLLVLAFACTLLPFALALVAMRQLSAYAAALAVNLEPLYAIVLAIVILNEQQDLGLQFYGGAALILLLVFLYPVLQRSRPSKEGARSIADRSKGDKHDRANHSG